MAEVPPFSAFYRAVNTGQEPFPWQRRLAERVVERGWPDEIGVPTGLGKTACLDIAVWSLAARGRQDRTLPTRIWYVVNRRLLVDAAWTRALRLAEALADPTILPDRSGAATGADVEAVAAVAEALGSLGAFDWGVGPLHVTRLRGAADLGARAVDPSQPALVCATVPMFASRWLFRGYGSSRSMRPIDAALAGIDSLVLLDEAHLARPLARLAGPLATCDPGDPAVLLPSERSRPRLVALTATGEAEGEGRFDLDGDDLAHPVVRRRLDAAKPVELAITSEAQLGSTMATQALALVGEGESVRTCVVFANTPRTARAVTAELERSLRRAGRVLDVRLLTGRVRDREADRLRAALLDDQHGVCAGRDRDPDRPVVVVATQTLEVGADLDFDALVSETAGARALVQRLGRLNRLGVRPHAQAVICHPEDRRDSPVYGTEPGDVWGRLTAAASGGPIDLTPAAVASVLGPPEDEPPRVGQLLPSHLWEWAKTSFPPPTEAPVEVFFDGFEEARREVSVSWRAHQPAEGVRLLPALTGAESVEVPIWELQEALQSRGVEQVRRLGPDRATLEAVPLAGLAPGDQVVLACDIGLYDEHGWNPQATGAVLDVSGLRAGLLLLSSEVLANLVVDVPDDVALLAERLRDPSDEVAEDDDQLATALLEQLRVCMPHPWMAAGEWLAFLDRLSPVVVRSHDDVAHLPAKRSRRSGADVVIRADAFEDLSFMATSASLREHLGSVGETAGRIAAHLGLPEPLVTALRRAGELHDLGKADPRFQRWLDSDGVADGPLAKSGLPRERMERARVASGWPRGGRHEALSARLAEQILDGPDGELVLHLVLSHHGHGRPLVPAVPDRSPTRLLAEVDGRRVVASGDLSVLDWSQPARFRALCERYGYWGLALLEAVLRRADHAVSHVVEVA